MVPLDSTMVNHAEAVVAAAVVDTIEAEVIATTIATEDETDTKIVAEVDTIETTAAAAVVVAVEILLQNEERESLSGMLNQVVQLLNQPQVDMEDTELLLLLLHQQMILMQHTVPLLLGLQAILEERGMGLVMRLLLKVIHMVAVDMEEEVQLVVKEDDLQEVARMIYLLGEDSLGILVNSIYRIAAQ